MLRITMILLCLLLAAAAAGRYQAEVSVREARREIREIESAKTKALTEIEVLRAEVAYLENPDRLASIARRRTDLRPIASAQLVTSEEFLAALGAAPAPALDRNAGEEGDVILHALALADASAIR